MGTEQCQAAADLLWEIIDHSLVDVWHDHHADDDSTFTYVQVEVDWSCHSQLDRIYLSHYHLSQAHSSSVRPAPFLDHRLVAMKASRTPKRLGPGYWHFNNSLLEDVGFAVTFQEFCLAWCGQRQAFPLVQRWWDVGKVCAQLFCHRYTQATSWQRDVAIEQLQQEVLELEAIHPSVERAGRSRRSSGPLMISGPRVPLFNLASISCRRWIAARASMP
ncbi:unnamed protein product [Caretta caretta]